ncbi:hypothetical protein H1P_4220002 [Hyella patelloides LEGE 07179]|uniref:Uncharacterized protein n=1 Tax=Hyella patelloides LEGE 07179 TaxID=945734 RepID=A0A563VXR9_9CYAN|nr:hypothetical protein [Hyella patelloides]VEP16242.1 hypothetical protein H1P_4220002 [Hyella patelloides LEGE 07179]
MRNAVPVLLVEISLGMESWELPIVTAYKNREGEYSIPGLTAFLEEAVVQGIRDLESGKETSVSGRIEIVPATQRRRRVRRGGAA